MRTMQVAGFVLVVFAIVLLALRAYDARTGPPLQPWHTYVPDELSMEQLDQGDWSIYLKRDSRRTSHKSHVVATGGDGSVSFEFGSVIGWVGQLRPLARHPLIVA